MKTEPDPLDETEDQPPPLAGRLVYSSPFEPPEYVDEPPFREDEDE